MFCDDEGNDDDGGGEGDDGGENDGDDGNDGDDDGKNNGDGYYDILGSEASDLGHCWTGTVQNHNC